MTQNQKIKTRKTIKESWEEYDKAIAKTHLANFGVIFLDATYNLPIDDLFELDEIYKEYLKKDLKN